MRIPRGKNGRGARAFTLLELMVVIAIIISMTALGALAYASIMKSTATRMSGRIIADAFRLARQYSVAQRVPCLVELVDVSEVAIYPNMGSSDIVRVVPYKRIRDNTTGGMEYVVTSRVLKEYVLRDSVKYVVLPQAEQVDADLDEDNVKDAVRPEKIFFRFDPDGTCSAAPAGDGDDTHNNLVIFEDSNTPRTARERGLLYIAPTTGFIKDRYYAEDLTGG